MKEPTFPSNLYFLVYKWKQSLVAGQQKGLQPTPSTLHCIQSAMLPAASLSVLESPSHNPSVIVNLRDPKAGSLFPLPQHLQVQMRVSFILDFPGGSDGKASVYNAGDLGSIPGLGRSPREGKLSIFFGSNNRHFCSQCKQCGIHMFQFFFSPFTLGYVHTELQLNQKTIT